MKDTSTSSKGVIDQVQRAELQITQGLKRKKKNPGSLKSRTQTLKGLKEEKPELFETDCSEIEPSKGSIQNDVPLYKIKIQAGDKIFQSL